MSYNNNFSYYNGPSTGSDWWVGKSANNASLNDGRLAPISPQNTWSKTITPPTFNSQISPQGYAQSMILPSATRAVEPTVSRDDSQHGVVTQLFSNFGYINDNIIFSKSDVVGQMVKVGDKVTVEATFQPNSPTTYKGERVCKIEDSNLNSATSANTLTQGRQEIQNNKGLEVKVSAPIIEPQMKSRFDVTHAVPKLGTPIVSRFDVTSVVPKPLTPTTSRFDVTYAVPKPVTPTTSRFDVTSVVPKPATSTTSRFDVTSVMPKTANPAMSRFDVSSTVPKPAAPAVRRFDVTTSVPKTITPAINRMDTITAISKFLAPTKSVSESTTPVVQMPPKIQIPVARRQDTTPTVAMATPKIVFAITGRADPRPTPLVVAPKTLNPPDIGLISKSSSQGAASKTDTSVNNLVDNRMDTSKRLSETKEVKHGSSKDKTISETDKNGLRDAPLSRSHAMSGETHRKLEAPKRKLIAPFKIQRVTKEVGTKEEVQKSKSETPPKSFESFALRELDYAAVNNHFRTLTIPAEFFHASLKYQLSFPLNHPMKLGNSCQFRVLDKRVKAVDRSLEDQLSTNIDPEDADTTFVAKIILMSTDDLAKFYKDTLSTAEEFDGDNKIPITKAIKFLVGSAGKDKEFGIGGAWSPSLDGHDPESNPRVLINTAIRTCRAVTGIDLSNCSSWPKFLELRYYRPLEKMPRKNVVDISGNIVIDLVAPEEPTEYREPRMETVVYYIPDVWNCMPSQESWSEIRRMYQEQLTCLMCPPPVSIKTPAKQSTLSSATVSPANEDKKTEDQEEEEDYNFNEMEDVGDKAEHSGDGELGDRPTHFSKLVVTGMKIVDIKRELELRKLNNRGVMEQLKARLKATLEKEEAEEKNKEVTPVSRLVPVVRQMPVVVLSADEKSELKKMYSLPQQAHILVHQNRKSFNKQMKLRTMTLHSLLSYHDVTLDESTFELALFARQFLDMLRRDAVFNIYKSIVVAPEEDLVNLDTSSTAKKPKLMVTTSKRTIDKPLLFSCSLLDRENTNKIYMEDLKVLIEGLGICLSSNQLCAVLNKVKDNSKYLNYRQLTDKEVTDADVSSMMNMDMSEDLDYVKELALGNKALFPDESAAMDSLDDEDEIERLKNELDKSERCRQAITLKVAGLKDETERNTVLLQSQTKKIANLKKEVKEYRSKYHKEQERGTRSQTDFDWVVHQLKDIDTLAVNLKSCVDNSLAKYRVDQKKAVKDERASSLGSKDDSVRAIEGTRKERVAIEVLKKQQVGVPVSMKEQAIVDRSRKELIVFEGSIDESVVVEVSIGEEEVEEGSRCEEEVVVGSMDMEAVDEEPMCEKVAILPEAVDEGSKDGEQVDEGLSYEKEVVDVPIGEEAVDDGSKDYEEVDEGLSYEKEVVDVPIGEDAVDDRSKDYEEVDEKLTYEEVADVPIGEEEIDEGSMYEDAVVVGSMDEEDMVFERIESVEAMEMDVCDSIHIDTVEGVLMDVNGSQCNIADADNLKECYVLLNSSIGDLDSTITSDCDMVMSENADNI